MIAETSSFERAWFKPIPIEENGHQTLEGLAYKITNWRHGEEAMDPFHDESGYLLWDKKTDRLYNLGYLVAELQFLRDVTAMHEIKKYASKQLQAIHVMEFSKINIFWSVPS